MMVNLQTILFIQGKKVEREYIIESKKDIDENLLISFKSGIKVKKEFFKLKSYEILNKNSARLILDEGKNREIRKVFLSKNIFLKKIHRIRIGNINLDSLKEGQVKIVPLSKINSLKSRLEKLNDNSN